MASFISPTELQKRVVIGILGVTLILFLIIYAGVVGAYFVATVLSLGMVSEFVEITFRLPDKQIKRFILIFLALIIQGIHGFFPEFAIGLIVTAFMALFGYYLFTANQYQGSDFLIHTQELMYSVFCYVYLVLLPLFLPAMRSYPSGLKWVILLFLIVWSGDTGAYFVGRKYGRRKLYAKISPKKTIEGAVGGLIIGTLIAALYKLTYFNQLSWLALLMISLLVGVGSQVGDLCESLLKRAFDKKDSGSILPGHGGFLDRFDSMVFSLPIMYACMRYVT